MSLESWWNIVSTSSWMVHGTEELKTFNSLLVTSLIFGKEIEVLELNELSGNLEGNLITPSVDEWHGHVIKEDGHLLATWWSVSSNLLLLNIFEGLLEVEWSSSTGEVQSLEKHLIGVEFGGVHEDDRGLSSTWSSNKEGVLMSWFISLVISHDWEVGNLLDDVLSSSGITSWDKELGELDSSWWCPGLSYPHLPLEGLFVDVVVINCLLVNLHSLGRD